VAQDRETCVMDALGWVSLVDLALAVAVVGVWWSNWGCSCSLHKVSEEPLPLPHEHHYILINSTDNTLFCIYCAQRRDLPRGTPQEPAEKVLWARAHRLGFGQGGRSEAFLEALERAG
jgi:hypothetical protein